MKLIIGNGDDVSVFVFTTNLVDNPLQIFDAALINLYRMNIFFILLKKPHIIKDCHP